MAMLNNQMVHPFTIKHAQVEQLPLRQHVVFGSMTWHPMAEAACARAPALRCSSIQRLRHRLGHSQPLAVVPPLDSVQLVYNGL